MWEKTHFYYVKPLKFGDLSVITAIDDLKETRNAKITDITQRKKKKGLIVLS